MFAFNRTKGETKMPIKNWICGTAIAIAGCLFALPSGAQEQQKADTEPKLQSFLDDPSLIRAAQFTPWGKIVMLQGGWGIDRMLLFHQPTPMTNPDGCTLLTNGYILNETHTGRNLFYSMLISALMNGREVALVISGCYQNRPQIVSVAIR
jgi:hypothetical protein